MTYFRSPWLSHLPQIKVEGRLARQSVRLVFFGIIGFLLLSLLLLIWQPKVRSGPVYLLYWLHDRLFLSFKAYTYTIFFPTSIIWWGIAATIFVLWLTSYLADRSLILQPHIWLLRFAIHQPSVHPTLVGFAQQFQPHGIESALLKTVAEYERDLACHYVGETLPSDVDPIAMRSVVRFTNLLVRLCLLPASRLSEHLYATVLWYEALLLLLGWEVAGGGEAENLKLALLVTLADCARLIGQRLPQWTNRPGEEAPAQSAFALEAFAADFTLTCHSQPMLAHHLFGADAAMRFDHANIRGQLARSVANRRVLLERLRQPFELDKRRNGFRSGHTEDGLGFSPGTTLTPRDLTLLGRLSVGIALYAACLGAAPEIALGYLDTVEMVGFTLAFSTNTRVELQHTYQELSALVAELPTRLDYQLCAALQASQLAARWQAWADSPLDDEELILPEDFDLADTQVATIRLAAGPPPLAGSYISYERAWVANALAQLHRLGPAYAVVQKHAPVYTAKVGEHVAPYTRRLLKQVGGLYTKYGKAEEFSGSVGTVRAKTHRGLQRILQQGQALYTQYIASGQASALLAEQWRQAKAYIDAMRQRWQ